MNTYEDRCRFRELHKIGVGKTDEIAVRYEEMYQLMKTAQRMDANQFEERVCKMMSSGWGASIDDDAKEFAKQFLRSI